MKASKNYLPLIRNIVFLIFVLRQTYVVWQYYEKVDLFLIVFFLIASTGLFMGYGMIMAMVPWNFRWRYFKKISFQEKFVTIVVACVPLFSVAFWSSRLNFEQADFHEQTVRNVQYLSDIMLVLPLMYIALLYYSVVPQSLSNQDSNNQILESQNKLPY